jgi:hypothetical protein
MAEYVFDLAGTQRFIDVDRRRTHGRDPKERRRGISTAVHEDPHTVPGTHSDSSKRFRESGRTPLQLAEGRLLAALNNRRPVPDVFRRVPQQARDVGL